MNKAGVQAQLADAAFKTLVEATVPWCLKILDGARDLPLVNAWANRRRGLGGGLLMLRYVTPDGVEIADLHDLTSEALRLFDGWQALAGGGITVILELPINEKFHTDMGEFAALAEASVPQAQRVKDAGFTPGVLITSEGNPPGDDYGAPFFLQPRVLACMRAFRRMGAVWCPHGYSHPPAPADDEYHFDRPRRILAQLPEDCRLNYAFGEIGCDGGTAQPDQRPGVGWQGYFGPIGDYAAWVRPQVRAMAADPLCVGGAVFLSGADPSGRPTFVSFDVRDEVDVRPVLTEAVPGPPITWLAPTPPEEPPMPDIALSVPTRASHAADGNWGTGEPFGPCKGVVIHSTGGSGRTLEAEYIGTVNWFTSPEAGVSAHRIVGAGKMAEVCTSVHDHEKAYHAREPSNTNRRGIELAHPDGPEWEMVAYPEFQYEAAGELIARWKLADEKRGWNWPLKLVSRAQAAADAPGIVFHRDLPAGIKDGRRDPTPPFDGAKLIAAATRRYAAISGGGGMPPTPTPTPTIDIAKERDALWAQAERLEKAGYSWLGQGIKALVAVSKGDK